MRPIPRPIRSRAVLESLEGRLLMSAPDANWRLVWGDEFNGTSLDHSKWSVGVPWNGPDGSNRIQDNNNLGYIQDSNVVVSDGTLKLIANRQDVTGTSGRVFHYTEGAIHSANSFSTAYGYFEISAQLPQVAPGAGAGIWPAFWMLGRGWPPEDDVAEWELGSNRMHQGLAYGSANNVHWNDINTYTPLPTGFHTYGMEWGPGYQIFYVDGHITHRVRGSMVPGDSMYMLLNNAISAVRPPNASTVFPNALEVDYVRVYKRTAGPSIANGGFEGGDLGLWTRANTADVVASNAHEGAYALQTTGVTSSVEQTITGLLPNTSYVATAWDKVSGAGNGARVGVKDSGGIDAFADSTSTDYTPASVTFTTGLSNTTATVYGMQTAGNGNAWFDDFQLHRAGVVENGTFETGTLSGWSQGVGASVVRQKPRHGHFALREDGAGAMTQQTIYGLSPNTTYNLTGSARTSSPGDVAVIGVSEPGAADLTATTSATRYTPLSLTFTTGATATSATVFCSKPIGTGSAWFDDLSLSGPVALTLSAFRNQSLRAGRASTLRFRIGGVATGSAPSLVASSSDPALLPADAFSFGTTGHWRTLTINPPADQSGAATVTLMAADDAGRTARQSFTLRVRAAHAAGTARTPARPRHRL